MWCVLVFQLKHNYLREKKDRMSSVLQKNGKNLKDEEKNQTQSDQHW